MKVRFKSERPHYDREKWGFKCNTVRKLEPDDERLPLLMAMHNHVQDAEDDLIIIDLKDGNESFSRKITDITIWEGLCIISWKHPE